RDEVSHNLLYRNDSVEGAAGFTERAVAAGVDDAAWGWGAAWLDADNDGDLDLAVTNGYCEIPIPDEVRYCDAVHERDRSRFFENRGEGNGFVEVGELVGFDDTLIGAGLVAADFDGDGRLDLLQTAIDPDSVLWEESSQTPRSERLTLYLNRRISGADDNRHAWVRPILADSGSPALGAVVRVRLDNGEILTRLVAAGESWMSQAPATVHFGLGTSAGIERIEIDWPGDDADSAYGSLPLSATAVVQGPETLFEADFE
ncbi:MAG TPA: CRTAC1 family protein, partial [Alphaproteobacteria bacterium]|nr:CRTAC1 family protein [Alphaproteobacteria bacterium]